MQQGCTINYGREFGSWELWKKGMLASLLSPEITLALLPPTSIILIIEIMTLALSPDLVRRYLAALGVQTCSPSLAALRELVTAHLTHVPFENISKLHHRQRGLAGLPPIELYLEGIERYHFGGTCYANNFHFYTLLASLGYEVRLCAADMNNPDVHLVILSTVGGHEFLVDAGYGAPFLDPIPLDLNTDYVITLGRDRYVLKPEDAAGRSRMELYRDGLLKHGYVIKPEPRRIEDFAGVIADSFRPTATFLNSLLLARFWQDHSIVIHNLMLVESESDRSKILPLASRHQLIAKIEEYFGMPRSIVAKVISELGELQDPWD